MHHRVRSGTLDKAPTNLATSSSKNKVLSAVVLQGPVGKPDQLPDPLGDIRDGRTAIIRNPSINDEV
jgi:hypothetical protein